MIDKNKLKEGDIAWACAFDIDLDRNTGRSDKVVHSRCKPVKGVIHNNHFHELKKSGTPKGGSVSLWARDFADTYEECVEIYNRKIGEKINKLCGTVKELRKELIDVKPIIINHNCGETVFNPEQERQIIDEFKNSP